MIEGVQWLSGRVLDSRPRGRGFEPHQCNCVVSLSKNINPSLVLVQPRKTCSFITERLLMRRKESNQTNKQNQFWLQITQTACIFSLVFIVLNVRGETEFKYPSIAFLTICLNHLIHYFVVIARKQHLFWYMFLVQMAFCWIEIYGVSLSIKVPINP